MRCRDELEEGPVLAQQEALGLGEGVVLAPLRIGGEAGAVGLVGCEALDVVDAVGQGGRALVRGEVANEVGAAARDRLASGAGVALEMGLLGRVDLVADDAGQHRSLLCARSDSALRRAHASFIIEA